MNGLIAFWNLDEESGTRYDEIGDNDLNDINTVLCGTGKINNAALLDSTNLEYLSIADNDDLSFGDENFTLAIWVKAYQNNIYNACLQKGVGATASQTEYSINVSSSPFRHTFEVSDGTTITRLRSDSVQVLNRWQCIVAWHNTDTDSLYIVVNGGLVKRGYATSHPRDHIDLFKLGRYTNTRYFDGLIDLVGIWGRCPTYTNGYAMADSIYNGGSGWCP